MPSLFGSPIALLLFVVTIVVSLIGFKNPKLVLRLAMSPYRVFNKREYERLVTSGFVHRDTMHLVFNMITFYFFAFGLEQYIGSLKFVLLYLVALVLGGVTHYKQRNDPAYLSIGASGAILGVMFAAIVYFPTSKLLLFPIPVPIPAWLYAVAFLAYSYWRSYQNRGDGTDHDAHITGALTGLAFVGLTDPRAFQTAIHSIFN
ncbi:MAG TPA: rhomboid family intramembrane serine protease [Steroidobacteraceae bacterium]|jgi:membrane associated rhomboid family serine protease|nr:rhomboid family intramembrane serine protease [Steroidobacteraceae bacterium]